ncbi:unnamed protein product [Brachionus calyciflorus]|uniref:Uncharacterized protein n=1 Tax=Brachionus calyciflorus TaxID=104777 RepID=A0A814H2G7_9BILA|nr:unnamed protein product [Brachionus calyciflorus]
MNIIDSRNDESKLIRYNKCIEQLLRDTRYTSLGLFVTNIHPFGKQMMENITKEINVLNISLPLKEKMKSSQSLIDRLRKELESEEDSHKINDKIMYSSLTNENLILIEKFEIMGNKFLGLHKTSKSPVFRGPKDFDFSKTEISQKEDVKIEPKLFGILKSKGSANGKDVFIRPKGGKFYISSTGSKCYINNLDSIEVINELEGVKGCLSGNDVQKGEKHDQIQKIIDDYEKKNGYSFVGYNESKGTANGRPIFEGPNGGKFYGKTKKKLKRTRFLKEESQLKSQPNLLEEFQIKDESENFFDELFSDNLILSENLIEKNIDVSLLNHAGLNSVIRSESDDLSCNLMQAEKKINDLIIQLKEKDELIFFYSEENNQKINELNEEIFRNGKLIIEKSSIIKNLESEIQERNNELETQAIKCSEKDEINENISKTNSKNFY